MRCKKLDYNLHTHTYLCNHTTGEVPEEYIKRAISNGIKYMGFSEHFPYDFSDNSRSEYRLPVKSVGRYFSELSALREKYRGQIDIKIGFEMEYYEEIFPDMLGKAREYGAEYLLLGQHFVWPEEDKKSLHVAKPSDDGEFLVRYADSVIRAIEKKVFTYVAHPDIFNFAGDRQVFKRELLRICRAAKESGTPLEINFLGIRDKRNYPCTEYFEALSETKAPVTFGMDAHASYDAFDGESLCEAEKIVRKYNLNYIGMAKIKEVQL